MTYEHSLEEATPRNRADAGWGGEAGLRSAVYFPDSARIGPTVSQQTCIGHLLFAERCGYISDHSRQ